MYSEEEKKMSVLNCGIFCRTAVIMMQHASVALEHDIMKEKSTVNTHTHTHKGGGWGGAWLTLDLHLANV